MKKKTSGAEEQHPAKYIHIARSDGKLYDYTNVIGNPTEEFPEYPEKSRHWAVNMGRLLKAQLGGDEALRGLLPPANSVLQSPLTAVSSRC